MKKLLVINAGSSSMKFKLFQKSELKVLAEGLAERLFIDGRISIKFNDQKKVLDIPLNSHQDAVEAMVSLFQKYNLVKSLSEIIGIGHRVVQGGEFFKESTLISDKETEIIDKLKLLAPLHNPGAIQGIKSFQKIIPNAKNVAVFDTSFHQTIKDEVFLYGVPIDWYEKHKVRKYGMHGTSHLYITKQCEKILKKDKVNIISAHLGNGASIAAIKNSKCINTTMGLTPLAGIIMGTRSGDIDPAIIEYMCNVTGKNVHEITNDLNKKSGVLGISGVSSDFRDIHVAAKKGNKKAILALEIYTKRIADVLAQYQNDLENKVDAIVFTAGIGENDSFVRSQIINKLYTFDLNFDYEKNKIPFSQDYIEITKSNSKIKSFVIRTNEELMIVKDLIKKANL